MDLSVSVITGTFGDESWHQLAIERAGASVPEGVPWIHAHGDTIAGARNAALAQVTTEFTIGLDADDELPGEEYIVAMATGTADVRVPMMRYMHGRRARLWQPRVAGHTHNCDASCLEAGNWVPIGACIRTALLRAVGYHDFPWSEDWATAALLARAGATFELIPGAEYIAHVRADSRNRAPDQKAKNRAHWQIHRAVWPEQYEDVA